MNDRDRVRIRHMEDACREALSFLAGRSREDLVTDRMFFLALVKEIEIIGEAAVQMSSEARTACPEIPWPRIIAMRNRLIHAYADVDVAILWETLTTALPELAAKLEATTRSL